MFIFVRSVNDFCYKVVVCLFCLLFECVINVVVKFFCVRVSVVI